MLCGSTVLFMASFGMVMPELPGYLAELGRPDLIGWIVGLFTVGAFFSRFLIWNLGYGDSWCMLHRCGMGSRRIIPFVERFVADCRLVLFIASTFARNEYRFSPDRNHCFPD